MIRKVKGIVIKSMKYKESDKIITVFTKEEGKLSFIGKNLSRGKNTSFASTSIFTYSQFLYYKGKSLHNINSTDYIKGFYGFEKDLNKMAIASYICELMDITYEKEIEDKLAFYLLLHTLNILNECREDVSYNIALAFMLKLLAINGSIPLLDSECVECGKESEFYYLDFENGGLICENCKDSFIHYRKISKNQLKFMKNLLDYNLKDLEFYKNKEMKLKDIGYLINIFNDYFVYTYEKKTNSFSFLYDIIFKIV